MIRKILSVVGGLFAGGIVVKLVEALAHAVFPISAGLDMNTPEGISTYIKNSPSTVLLFVVAGWTIGSFIAGLAATMIARELRGVYALICGCIFFLLILMVLLVIPHPIWVWIVSLALIVPAAWIGFLLARIIRR